MSAFCPKILREKNVTISSYIYIYIYYKELFIYINIVILCSGSYLFLKRDTLFSLLYKAKYLFYMNKLKTCEHTSLTLEKTGE